MDIKLYYYYIMNMYIMTSSVPNTGIHSIRLFNIAIIDVLLTVIVAYILSLYIGYSFWLILGVSFILGIVIHRLLNIQTTIDRILFE
jgi:hypothetical protein